MNKSDTHYVYLLTRSDGKLYVGICLTRRIRQRMNSHRVSKRFKEWSFDLRILEELVSRDEALERELYWISKLDTYNNGLNGTKSGSGYGHGSPDFTTLGFTFSEESKRKMSASRKAWLSSPEGRKQSSEVSKRKWENPEFREKQMAKRKNWSDKVAKKLTDQQALELIDRFKRIENTFTPFVAKNGKAMSPMRQAAEVFAKELNMTTNGIMRILNGTRILPK